MPVRLAVAKEFDLNIHVSSPNSFYRLFNYYII